MVLPDVAPVSGRNSADVEAVLADPTAPVVEPAPSAVVEPSVSSEMGAVQPAMGLMPPAEVVSGGGAELAPPEIQVEMATTTPSPVGLDVAVLASEGMEQSVPPAAPVVVDEAGRIEVDTAGGSSGVVVVAHRTRREPPPAPLSGGVRSPARGEPPLQWMSPRDPSSVALSLDDHAESMERESLDFGISSMMEALNQAREVLRRVFVPTTQVSA